MREQNGCLQRQNDPQFVLLFQHPLTINVVANEQLGFIISETGAGCTWRGNSREHRLTPWYNDPLLDPHGEALYVRDEESGAFWSPLPGPAVPARFPERDRRCSFFPIPSPNASIASIFSSRLRELRMIVISLRSSVELRFFFSRSP